MDELINLAKKYSNLVLLSSLSAQDSECDDFEKFFSDRFFTFGMAERAMITAAAGFALRGKLPVVVGRGILTKAKDQIEKDLCAPNLNVKIIDLEGGSCEGLEKFKRLEELLGGYGPAFLELS